MKKPDEKAMAQSRLMSDTRAPVPYDVYEHYKGGLYVVVAVSVHEETLVPMVTYRSNKTKAVQTRTLENWTSTVEVPAKGAGGKFDPIRIPRFRQINM